MYGKSGGLSASTSEESFRSVNSTPEVMAPEAVWPPPAFVGISRLDACELQLAFYIDGKKFSEVSDKV